MCHVTNDKCILTSPQAQQHIAAMRRALLGDASIRDAMASLSLLAAPCAAGQAAVAAAAGLEAVVAAMTAALADAPLQAVACAAVWCIADGNAVAGARAVEAGAVAALAAALCNHPAQGDAPLEEHYAARALQSVARAHVAASGGVKALATALRARASPRSLLSRLFGSPAAAGQPVPPSQAAMLLASIDPAWAYIT